MAPRKKTDAVLKASKNVKPVKKPEKTSSAALSEEFVRNSDDDSSFSEDSSSEDEVSAGDGIGATTGSNDLSSFAQLKKSKPIKASQAASDDEEASEQVASSESDAESSSGEDTAEAQQSEKKTKQAATAATEESRQEIFASKTYTSDFQPPPGYSGPNAKTRVALSAELRDVLSKDNLRQKQLWHISVPSHIPVTKLTEMTLQSIGQGGTVLRHKDDLYHFNTSRLEGEAERQSILLPSNNTYVRLDAPIVRQISLSQDMAHTNGATRDAGNLPSIVTTAQRRYEKAAPPKQPSGLRMRNHPLGVVQKRKAPSPSAARKKVRHETEAELVHRSVGVDNTAQDKAARKAERRAKKERKRLDGNAKSSQVAAG